MKNKFLFPILLLGLITLYFSCQKEDDLVKNTSAEKGILKVEQIPYISVKKEYRQFIRQFNRSLVVEKIQNKSSSPSITVDTSSVTHIVYDNYSSYTFPVMADSTSTSLANVFISEQSDGAISYFLMSYDLDTTLDHIDESNVESHILSRTALEIEASDIIFGSKDNLNGGDCWSVDTYTVNYCEDADGNTIINNGQSGNDCFKNWHRETYYVTTIDVGCSGGGGEGPDTGSVGDGSGAPNEDGGSQGGIPSGSGITKPTVPCIAKTGLGGSDGCGTSIDMIARDNLFDVLSPYLTTQEQADWIYFSADYTIVSALNYFIQSSTFNNQSQNKNTAATLVGYLTEGIISSQEAFLTLATLSNDTPWIPNVGIYNGVQAFAYYESRTIISNGRQHFQYKLVNNDDILSVSSYPPVAGSNQLVPVFFYFNQATQLWYDFQEPSSYEPLTLDFLWDGFWSTTLTAVRVFTPLEDIIILIDGKDLEGVEQSRAVAATFILVDIIPGSSAVKAIKMVKYGDEAIQLAEAVVKYVDDIYKSQKETIQNVLDGLIDLDQFDNTIRKGNFGEMVTDEDLYSRGYEPLHIRRTDIDQPLDTGIDGVFKNPETGEYIIVESKFNNAQLRTLEDGTRQMSDEWITNGLNDASDRLFIEIGSDPILYDDIMLNGYQRIKAKVLSDGTVTYRFIGSDGYVILGNAGIFTP